ncbi:MAG: SRPBCC family protein [Myxococcales bacterium]
MLDETTAKGFKRIWIDYTVEVDASEAELSALLSDIDHWPSWTPGLKAIKRKSNGDFGVGTHFVMVLEVKGLPGLPLPCELFVKEPRRIEWGGGALGSVIRHRFELTSLGPTRTSLRHVEYATNLLALVTLPAEKGIHGHDRRWSNAIRARFARA